jgi:hypothetical protein
MKEDEGRGDTMKRERDGKGKGGTIRREEAREGMRLGRHLHPPALPGTQCRSCAGGWQSGRSKTGYVYMRKEGKAEGEERRMRREKRREKREKA